MASQAAESPSTLETPPERTPKTSELLAELTIAGSAEDRLALGALLDRLGGRAQGLAVVLFALAGSIPYPPGVPVPMICGVVLVLIALQMSPRRRRLHLPNRIRDRTIARRELRRISQRLLPWVLKMEQLSRPRLQFVFGTAGRAVTKTVIAVLGLVMVLPIPVFGNTPPGLAIAAIGLGLVQRDGLIVLIGLSASILALAISLSAVFAILDRLW